MATNSFINVTPNLAQMNIENQPLREQYLTLFYSKVQELAAKRDRLGISQQVVADTAGVSLRTIQRFERYNVLDGYILYVYEKMFA